MPKNKDFHLSLYIYLNLHYFISYDDKQTQKQNNNNKIWKLYKCGS